MTGPAPKTAIDPLPAGTQIMEHRVLDVIGRGGFGIVYLVEHPNLRVRAAVKEFCPSRMARRESNLALAPFPGCEELYHDIRARFDESARELCRLSHPNIVQLQNHSTANNTSYILMECVEGETLDAWFRARTGTLTPEDVRQVIDPVLDAISYLHAKHLMHRDISPDNVLVEASGRPVVIDFGTLKAHVLEEESSLQEDEVQSAVVSKRYFSPPEQMATHGKADYSFAGDVYSLAATIYDVLAGRTESGARHLVSADRRQSLIAMGSGSTDIPPFAEVTRIDMGPVFAAAIDAALSLNPLDRPQSVEAFRVALLGAAEPRVHRAPPARKRWQGRRLGLATSALAVAAVAGGISLDTSQPKIPTTPPPVADNIVLPAAAAIGGQPSDPASVLAALAPCGALYVPHIDNPLPNTGGKVPLLGQVPDIGAKNVLVEALEGFLPATFDTSTLVETDPSTCAIGLEIERLGALATRRIEWAEVMVATADGILPAGQRIDVEDTGQTDYAVGLDRASLPPSGYLWSAAIVQDEGRWTLVPLGPYGSASGTGWIELGKVENTPGPFAVSRGPAFGGTAQAKTSPRLFAAKGEQFALIFGFVTSEPFPGLADGPVAPEAAIKRIKAKLSSGPAEVLGFFARPVVFK